MTEFELIVGNRVVNQSLHVDVIFLQFEVS